MKIQAVSALYDNYIWIIINEKDNQVLCVDPGEAPPVLNYLKKEDLTLNTILLTHHHNDHIGGVPELLKALPGLEVYGPKDDRIPKFSHILKKGERLKLGSLEFQILSTPGHTATHICFYEPHQGWLFCGDTLFSAGCGRVFDGTMEQLHNSLQLLKNLPDDTQVFCGHEYTQANLRFAATVEPENLTIRSYAQRLLAKENQCSLPSSIGVEKEINPFFRTDSTGVQAFAKAKGSQNSDSLSVFTTIREAKDNF